MKESTKVNKQDMNCATNENNFAIQTFGVTKEFGNLIAVDGVDLGIKKASCIMDLKYWTMV